MYYGLGTAGTTASGQPRQHCYIDAVGVVERTLHVHSQDGSTFGAK